ncbi:MAG: type I-E CRISPR-associated endonuclease Cas1e [Fimbriimonadaceae bacterium]|nr:type I-E CRISPR-associated endonuclease Cas1e [Fimbriimonadaceae bacterium]NUM38011.1 type I-E CRISPR-associated endonuclease Cas1 [Armatimonadota bacterium]
MPADLHLLPKLRDRLSYLYAEHCVIEREESAIALWDEEGMIQVPVASVALLMLGPGTKISHAAMDVLARDNCLVAWVGEGAVRMYAFGTGGTHSAARLLRQAELVSDPASRLRMVRKLYGMRFPEALDDEVSIEQLRGKEGFRVRTAYQEAAEKHGIEWEGRNYDRNQWSGSDPANRALSSANACLYGVCHAAILSMGFSPALGFIHTGKQLSFVYDVADLYKLEMAVPAAFQAVAGGEANVDRAVRLALRDRFKETRFVSQVAQDLMSLFGSEIPEEEMEVYDDDPALPAELWEGPPPTGTAASEVRGEQEVDGTGAEDG